jgi:hypothetical protein
MVPWLIPVAERCLFCGESVSAVEVTDGVFVWPKSLSHYVGEHSVRLPRAVIEHVHRQRRYWHPDDKWWKSVVPD